MAAFEYRQNVAQRRAFRRRDDSDLPRDGGIGRFRSGRNRPFLLELFLELLKGELQRAEAGRLQHLNDDLVFSARFVAS